MTDERHSAYAAFFLRVSLGVLMLAHAYSKVFGMGIEAATKWFGSMGLPPAAIYGIIGLEVIGGLALIFGILTRWIAILFAVEFIATIYFVHGAKGWLAGGGGWEYSAMLAVMAVALALLGDGAFAVTGRSRSTTT